MTGLKKLNVFALTLLITGAIDSIRNLPAAALFGSTLIFFFIFAAIVFLIPTALVSAELAANSNQSGIYQWTRLAFGERFGFFAIWLQWINNVVWFPTILSFIAGTAAYIFDPQLAQSKFYLVTVILSTFWLLTLVNLKGIRLSAKFTSFCAITGLIIPMVLILCLFAVWLYSGRPLQVQFTAQDVLPNLNHTENWLALTAIILGFSGMELAAVHINDVDQPQKNFPRALAISTIIILITMTFGSLAIACVVPANTLNLVDGTIQTFAYFFKAYHLGWCTPIITILLVVGSFGGVINWVIAPIKGISQAANNGFMPPFFQRVNHHGVPQNLLLTQAVLVSFVCLAFLLLPSVNGSYWLLTALSTQLYTVMYVLMFAAALKLRKKMRYSDDVFCIPGKNFGLWLVCLLGLFGCLCALLVGFIPPSSMNIGSNLYYELLFLAGIVVMLAPVLFFYAYHKYIYQKKQESLVQAIPVVVSE